MQFTLTLSEQLFDQLRAAVFSIPDVEGAAFVLCRASVSGAEHRLLAVEVIPVQPEHYLVRESDRLSVVSEAYVPLAKTAATESKTVLFVHSHPNGPEDFSPQDDREEPRLMEFLTDRAPNVQHGSMVVTPHSIRGRVWDREGWNDLERVRVLGSRFRFHGVFQGKGEPFYDRQVRAFGTPIQSLLSHLHVGVVGAGGTGSATIEQLARLGVGTLSVFDGDSFEDTNVNRIYGSRVTDRGRNKAELAADHIRAMGLGTDVRAYDKHITDEATARELRACDVIFGCTDLHTPRGLLVQLAIRYLIPVVDMGVKIEARDEQIDGVYGRVTVLFPGEACLFCRGRISSEVMRLERMAPEERKALADEEYAPRLDTPNPAVISFTTAVASQAVSEFLHRLTGFMGDRVSSETLLLLDGPEVRSNRLKAHCTLCTNRSVWGRGDELGNFLGVTW